jgi:hypothetical protein
MPLIKIQSAILVLISKAFAEGEASIRVSRVSIIIIIINGYFHLGILQTGSLKSIVYIPTSTSEGRKEGRKTNQMM